MKNSIIEKNRQSYDAIAPEFSKTRGFVWKDVEYLMNFVNETDDRLDLGCGNGRLLKINCRNGACPVPADKYLGIDSSENLIAEARKENPDYRFETGDVLDLKKTVTKKFDVVFMISVLNHFPKELQDQAIENANNAELGIGDYAEHVDPGRSAPRCSGSTWNCAKWWTPLLPARM